MPQGRFLNTPELIPFRLTRDIVDGFGIAGAVHLENTVRVCVSTTLRLSLFARIKNDDVGAQAWRG